MSKNIVGTYTYSEGPFVISLIEDEEGNIEESREHVYNYTRKYTKRPKRKYYSKEPLNRYSKYNDQIRTTDVWSMYDN